MKRIAVIAIALSLAAPSVALSTAAPAAANFCGPIGWCF